MLGHMVVLVYVFSAINSPLCPMNFDMLYNHFHSFQCVFGFPLRIPLWPMDYLDVCLVSKCLEVLLFSLLLTSSLIS